MTIIRPWIWFPASAIVGAASDAVSRRHRQVSFVGVPVVTTACAAAAQLVGGVSVSVPSHSQNENAQSSATAV
jgi:hypothetical protein